MNRLIKCQIAELIEDSLIAQGFKGKTVPFVWSGMLFGSLFESNVPVESMTLREKRAVAVWIFFLSPIVIVAIVLAWPFEWLRGRHVDLHNAKMQTLLLNGGNDPGSGGAASDIKGRVVITYRIESEGRAVFFGTALVACSAERRDLLGFTVHREVPPRSAVDGESLMSALVERGSAVTELCHWQWSLRDPYELIARPARPW